MRPIDMGSCWAVVNKYLESVMFGLELCIGLLVRFAIVFNFGP